MKENARSVVLSNRSATGQVVGILESRVHTLRPDRAMNVGRIAEQKAAAGAKAM